MMKKCLLFLITLLLFFSPADASADGGHTGFDLGIHMGEPLIYQTSKLNYRNGNNKGTEDSKIDDPLIGLSSVKLSFGYKWKYIGVYLEQELGGVLWDVGEPVEYDGEIIYKYNNWDYDWFLSAEWHNKWIWGGTFICAKGMLPIGGLLNNRMEIDLTTGLGMVYSDEGADHVAPLTFNFENELSPWLAFKFGIAITYFFTDVFGMGINFDYNLVVRIFKLSESVNKEIREHYNPRYAYKSDVMLTILLHQISPGIHFRFNF